MKALVKYSETEGAYELREIEVPNLEQARF